MKRKDVTYLILAVVVLLVAGYLGYTQLLPKTSGTKTASKEVEVELVGPITSSFDQTALTQLSDPTQVRNFGTPIDVTTGLGTTAPFGQ